MQNNIFKKRITSKTKLKIIAVVAVILLIAIYVIWDLLNNGPLTSFLNNKDTIISWVEGHGFLGPLAFIFLQVLQIVLAPIPGQIVGGVGGFLFSWWGVLWTCIGTAIGGFIVFWLSRKFGRPLVEKIVKKDSLDKFDFIFSNNTSFILFVIFLIPGLPDDIICYLAGLTNISLKKLVTLFVIGRLPAIIIINYLGSGIGEENLAPVVVISVIVAIVLALIVWQREKIIGFLKKLQQNKH